MPMLFISSDSCFMRLIALYKSSSSSSSKVQNTVSAEFLIACAIAATVIQVLYSVNMIYHVRIISLH